MSINRKSIEEYTRWNISSYESLEKYLENMRQDPKKTDRIGSQKCVSCYYHRGKMAMQSFHTVNCKCCNEEMTFSTSVVDKLCKSCGEKNQACVHCMGSIDLMSEISKKNLKNKVSDLK